MIRKGLMVNGILFATVCESAKGEWCWHSCGKIKVMVKGEERVERRSGRTCASEKECLIDIAKFITRRLGIKITALEFCEAPAYQFVAKPVEPELVAVVDKLLSPAALPAQKEKHAKKSA